MKHVAAESQTAANIVETHATHLLDHSVFAEYVPRCLDTRSPSPVYVVVNARNLTITHNIYKT